MGVEVNPSPETFHVGALIIRIWFWGFLIIIIVYYTPKPYSTYQGPYIKQVSSAQEEREKTLAAKKEIQRRDARPGEFRVLLKGDYDAVNNEP